jgi:hypothetical protein
VASSNGLTIPLDYNTSATDEMTVTTWPLAGNGMHQMTTKAAADKLKSDGWKIVETTGFCI